MTKTLLAGLLAGAIGCAPAMAAPIFTPFTMNLSATDVNTASYNYNFEPGSYTVTLVRDLYTAFAPATPSPNNWTDYYQYSVDGGNSFTFYNPTNSNARFATAEDAFNAFAALPALSLSFANATAVTFRIGDSLTSLGDNSGGTSLRVAAAVPEPATWAMMLLGFGGIGFAMRRRPAVKALRA